MIIMKVGVHSLHRWSDGEYVDVAVRIRDHQPVDESKFDVVIYDARGVRTGGWELEQIKLDHTFFNPITGIIARVRFAKDGKPFMQYNRVGHA